MAQPGRTSDESVRVESLKLASWLRLNRETLLSRERQPDGKIAYLFDRSDSIAGLIEAWQQGKSNTLQLSRFASIVSFEIRFAQKGKGRPGLTRRSVSDGYR